MPSAAGSKGIPEPEAELTGGCRILANRRDVATNLVSDRPQSYTLEAWDANP